ncbi:MAG: HDOD domain-containing protein [Desulfarculaceae bacterium]|jgi:HD-like signal output (HDOD) protein
MGQEDKNILEQALAQGAVPSLSPLALRLVDMASQEESSAQDLASLIEKDAGLTTRLLKLVNSPVFSRGAEEVTSITRAVVLLGLREIRIMALSISLRDTLPIKKGGTDYHLFWRASLHRAVLARETALRLALENPEEAFVGGLILELGLPLLLKALGEERFQGFPGPGAALKRQLAWEQEHLGLDHRQLGAEAIRRWGLPESLAACQQVVQERPPQKAPILVEVCDFARRATESFFLPECPLSGIHQVAWRRFGFNAETVNQILTTALSYVGQAAESLEIELDQEADLLAVMENANAALSRLSRQVEPHVRDAVESVAQARQSGAEQRRLQELGMVTAMEAVAHEIRNPLMSVGGFARRLTGSAQQPEQVRQYAQVIVDEAARLDQVLAEMVALVAPYKPASQKMDLAALIRGLTPDRVLPITGLQKELFPEIKLHLPQGPFEIEADLRGMEAALKHLLSYSCHLMQSAPQAVLHLHLQEKEGQAVITLFGAGDLPSPDNDPLAGKSFGPELGLARARRILEAHGGGLTMGPAAQGGGFVISASLPL